jgi:dihydropteroate synthase-like protein
VEQLLFITGKLAARALKKTLTQLGQNFQYEVNVLNCTVAAFMNTEWIAGHLSPSLKFDRIIIPGLSEGDLSIIEKKTGIPAQRGPNDLKDLPLFFGEKKDLKGYGAYETKIIAEIVDSYALPVRDILKRAGYYRDSGADIIDIGCPARGDFKEIETTVSALKESGYIVSVDTFNRDTALKADRAGVDIILSVNSENIDIVQQVNAKVVVIPDFGEGIDSLYKNISKLDAWGKNYIIDPILEPLCMGFTESINRLIQVRRKFPDKEIMVGLGNVTELTDADSVGINTILAAIAAELDINYVLTTEVISWARGAVKELDLARKLMHYACENHIPPKRINDSLITIKDPPFKTYNEAELRIMQIDIEDKNYRIFTDDKQIYLFNSETFVSGNSPLEIFDNLCIRDAKHAFYLGKELERAALAIRLGKKYVQEKDLRWGYM